MNKRKFVLWAGLGLIIILSILVIYLWKNNPNPAAELRLANTKISECVSRNGENFASSTLNDAKNYYDSAIKAWEAENQKWIVFRNYDNARNYANKAYELAGIALRESQNNESRAREELQKKITKIEKCIELYDSVLYRLPPDKSQYNAMNRGKLLYHEALLLFEQESIQPALSKVHSSSGIIEPMIAGMRDKLEEYFKDFELWKKNFENTIEWTRQNKTKAIIVDKFSRRCELYERGKLVSVYPVELGRNPLTHKSMQGDNATPEGIYSVIKKKSGIHTRYHKALLINYPNEEDKLNFQDKIKKGILEPQEKIGGAIEIHGHGGKGGDWTEGCIALKNDEMDIVYNFAGIGTRVTIVGSTLPLSHFIPGN